MSVQDRWHRRTGEELCSHGLYPAARHGEGKRWLVRYRGHPSRAFESKGAAERYWLKCRTEVPKAASEVTVGELLDRWLAGKQGLSKSRIQGTSAAAARVRKRWGDVRVTDVTEQDVREWQASIRDVEASSIRKAMEALSGCMLIAVKMGAVTENPCAGVRRPTEPKRDARFLEPEELLALADAADALFPRTETSPPGYNDKVMVLFMGTTGFRIGEVSNTRIGQIDRKRLRAWVASRTAKSRKGREVGVPAELMRMLTPMMKGRGRDEFLFTGRSGAKIDPHNWRDRHFYKAVERAGLGDMHPHDLRHTAVSLAVKSGADLKTVQSIAGHSSGKLTYDTYTHLFDKGIDDAAERMGKLVFGGGQG
jgi:integrase